MEKKGRFDKNFYGNSTGFVVFLAYYMKRRGWQQLYKSQKAAVLGRLCY